MTVRHILLAEDGEDDVFLMRRAIIRCRISAGLNVARDGQEAMDYLAGKGEYADRGRFPLPQILFLDGHMPRRDGWDVLDWLRGYFGPLAPIPIMFTDSGTVFTPDAERAYRLGAASCLQKPPTAESLDRLAEALHFDWQKEA